MSSSVFRLAMHQTHRADQGIVLLDLEHQIAVVAPEIRASALLVVRSAPLNLLLEPCLI